MSRTLQRVLATGSAAVVLAASVGAGAALAAPASFDPAAAAPPAVADADRCASAREAAREEPTVANLQAVGRCEIDRRLDTLAKLQKVVDASKALTDAHEAALDGILVSTTSGLTKLRAEIDATTTVEGLREAIRRIFEDFRVYVLVSRQVRLVVADDVVLAAANRAETAASRVEQAIKAAEAAGRDVAAARAHLAAMKAAIDGAKLAVEGDASAVLDLTPVAWNAGGAKPILDDARSSVAKARASLRTAVREARSALADLR